MPSSTRTYTTSSKTGKPKKVVKHSKKFVRTQTGCLQCRQKKKKCDGKRPVCVSCDKRGICCEFPANIRFFQFNQSSAESRPSSTSQKTGSFGVIDTSSVIMKKSSSAPEQETIKNEEIDSISPSKRFQFKNETVRSTSTIPSAKKLTRSQSHSSSISESSLSLQSRSSSLSSIAPSLISDHSDTESLLSFPAVDDSLKAPRLLSTELLNIISDTKSGYKSTPSVKEPNHDPTERALNLANDGESIGNILNNIAIDLIKRSIHNLNYIDFDTKLNNYYINQESQFELTNEIKQGLAFVEKNCALNFKPDEFLSFEE